MEMNWGHIRRTMDAAVCERLFESQGVQDRKRTKEKNSSGCPAVVTGSIAKGGNTGFYTFKYNHKLTHASA